MRTIVASPEKLRCLFNELCCTESSRLAINVTQIRILMVIAEVNLLVGMNGIRRFFVVTRINILGRRCNRAAPICYRGFAALAAIIYFTSTFFTVPSLILMMLMPFCGEAMCVPSMV